VDPRASVSALLIEAGTTDALNPGDTDQRLKGWVNHDLTSPAGASMRPRQGHLAVTPQWPY
jgi:hypothetical protein